MMRLCDVGVEAARAREESPRSLEIAALELHQAEVDERVDEGRAVFEREAQPRVRRLQITGGQRFDPGIVEGDRSSWQWSPGRTAGEQKSQGRPHLEGSAAGRSGCYASDIRMNSMS